MPETTINSTAHWRASAVKLGKRISHLVTKKHAHSSPLTMRDIESANLEKEDSVGSHSAFLSAPLESGHNERRNSPRSRSWYSRPTFWSSPSLRQKVVYVRADAGAGPEQKADYREAHMGMHAAKVSSLPTVWAGDGRRATFPKTPTDTRLSRLQGSARGSGSGGSRRKGANHLEPIGSQGLLKKEHSVTRTQSHGPRPLDEVLGDFGVNDTDDDMEEEDASNIEYVCSSCHDSVSLDTIHEHFCSEQVRFYPLHLHTNMHTNTKAHVLSTKSAPLLNYKHTSGGTGGRLATVEDRAHSTKELSRWYWEVVGKVQTSTSPPSRRNPLLVPADGEENASTLTALCMQPTIFSTQALPCASTGP